MYILIIYQFTPITQHAVKLINLTRTIPTYYVHIVVVIKSAEA